MKPLLFAAALLLLPVSAQAQVAAGAIPNSFDGPAAAAPRAAPTAAPPAPAAPAIPPATTPANPRSEEVLREIIAGAQAGTVNYALMTDDLGVQAVDFVGSQNGADLFAVTFATAATEWVIGFDEADKVAALLFRPAE